MSLLFLVTTCGSHPIARPEDMCEWVRSEEDAVETYCDLRRQGIDSTVWTVNVSNNLAEVHAALDRFRDKGIEAAHAWGIAFTWVEVDGIPPGTLTVRAPTDPERHDAEIVNLEGQRIGFVVREDKSDGKWP